MLADCAGHVVRQESGTGNLSRSANGLPGRAWPPLVPAGFLVGDRATETDVKAKVL